MKRLASLILFKLPAFLAALPFVLLMRMLRPLVRIRLISISERIGHGTANTDVYLLERSAGLHDSGAVDVFYPERPWKCNRQMISMWRRLVPFHDLVYWIAWANLKIPGHAAHHYNPPRRDRDINGLSNDAPPPVSFTREEEERGAALLRDMGIPPGSRIVCFHARDNAYLDAAMPEVDWGYHAYRDVDVDTYSAGLKELVDRGYYAIRMGRAANKPLSWNSPRLVDYATSAWRSDFADMYLVSRCHFFMGNSCGLDSVAALFRKQWLVVNLIPIKLISGWSPNYLFIFKKLRLVRENRFLTFKEMIDSEAGLYLRAAQYKAHGLEVVNNTPEEILDAVDEKEQRLRGCWRTNEEYEDLQRRFWALFKPDSRNNVFRARVGSKFLLRNKDLLGAA